MKTLLPTDIINYFRYTHSVLGIAKIVIFAKLIHTKIFINAHVKGFAIENTLHVPLKELLLYSTTRHLRINVSVPI